MNRKKLHYSLSGFIILLAIVACAIPGQTLQPSPDTNSNAIETAVVGTAQAAAKQTEQAGLIAATPTQIPLETPPSADVISSYGTSLVKLEDGSSRFKDYRAGVQIIFPSNWLALRAGEPEYYEAWENEGAQNLVLLDAITSTQNLDLNTFRVTAYDMHPEHTLYDNLPKINVVLVQDDQRTLEQVEADEKNRVSPMADYQFLSSEFQETSNGIQILVIQHQWRSSDTERDYLSLYKGVLFKVPTGTVAIDLFIPFDQKEALWPEYDQIVDGITLFTP